MDFSKQKIIIFFAVSLVVILSFSFVAYKISKRVERQNLKAPQVKVTIPEGSTISDIQNIFSAKLPVFNKTNFLIETKDKEGYLFPDTYLLLLADDSTKAVSVMSDNFVKKLAPFIPEVNASGHTEKDIITMASIIEKEAKGDVDRSIISGILWKRLSKGMLLEVDSAPETYKNAGLPTSPICNPGIETIKAALHPESSPYFFYLHDKNGVAHYAVTFDEHKANKIKYLK